MSGGQKRRVAIAGILAMNPDILILDEPTAGLDPQGTNEMMSLFKRINESGKTIILVTHDMNHVLQYCDEVVVMNHGKVEKHDTVTNVFKDSEYLNSLGIDLPIITNFIIKLNNQGFNLDSSINNIEQLIAAIGGELNGNMTFGKYIPVNSLIHQLDPRLKIGALLIFLIAIFFDAGFIGYGIMGVFVLLVAGLSNISIKHILKAIKPMVFMMLFLMIFNIFLINTGSVLFTIGSLKIYSGALIQSAYIFIRLILIITLTTILTSSTKPLDLTLAIENLLNPFKQFWFSCS